MKCVRRSWIELKHFFGRTSRDGVTLMATEAGSSKLLHYPPAPRRLSNSCALSRLLSARTNITYGQSRPAPW
jgi:hypothetical protein